MKGTGRAIVDPDHLDVGFVKTLWDFVMSADYYPRVSTSRSTRLTPGGIIFFAILLHSLAVYTLISGNMIGRRAPAIIDGRHSVPILYWAYAGFMVFGSVVFDVILVLAYREFARGRNEREI